MAETRSKKVLVTGSRDFPDRDIVWYRLNMEFDCAWGILIHGYCKTGADDFAHAWAQLQPDIYEIPIEAKWKHPGLRRYAGHARNLVMLDLNPDVVLAFYASGALNRGTDHCVTEARLRGIEVKEFWDTEMHPNLSPPAIGLGQTDFSYLKKEPKGFA